MHLANGTPLQGGKYRIVRFISSGGFGCTYEAEHVMLHRRVAIKEFFVKDFCNRDEATAHVTVATQGKASLVGKLRRKFVDEAVALNQMRHANIVSVTDVFEENGTAYYVMDFIDGESLHEMVKRRGALPEKEAVGYITQVADALRYVHAQNRLHLDIKPGNIMVDRSGKAMLIDFGTSKQYDEEAGENTSTLMGKTPGYAPIEQMGNSVQNFTPATDIYSLGATLYKLLSGVTPPEATILVSDDEALKPLPASVSPAVKKAVEWAMKVRRKERPQSIDEWSLSPNPSPVACARASSEGRGDYGREEDDEATVFDAPIVKTTPVVKKQAEEPVEQKVPLVKQEVPVAAPSGVIVPRFAKWTFAVCTSLAIILLVLMSSAFSFAHTFHDEYAPYFALCQALVTLVLGFVAVRKINKASGRRQPVVTTGLNVIAYTLCLLCFFYLSCIGFWCGFTCLSADIILMGLFLSFGAISIVYGILLTFIWKKQGIVVACSSFGLTTFIFFMVVNGTYWLDKDFAVTIILTLILAVVYGLNLKLSGTWKQMDWKWDFKKHRSLYISWGIMWLFLAVSLFIAWGTKMYGSMDEALMDMGY